MWLWTRTVWYEWRIKRQTHILRTFSEFDNPMQLWAYYGLHQTGTIKLKYKVNHKMRGSTFFCNETHNFRNIYFLLVCSSMLHRCYLFIQQKISIEWTPCLGLQDCGRTIFHTTFCHCQHKWSQLCVLWRSWINGYPISDRLIPCGCINVKYHLPGSSKIV